MDFGFSEEEQLFKNSMREFAEKELAPYYMDRSKKDSFDPVLTQKLADMGLFGMAISKKYGGSREDSTCVMFGILSEEFGRADQNALARVNFVLPRILEMHASEEIKEKWLPAIVSGKTNVGGLFTEPEGGTDAATVRVTAVKDGGDYILNGEKTSITLMDECRIYLVSTQTLPGARAHGVSLFVVPDDLPGIEKSHLDDISLRPIARGTVKFTDVRIPASYMVGKENAGFYPVIDFFDIARTSIALGVIGCAEKALEDAAKYASQRMMFGKKLSQMQSISFQFAEYHTRLEAAKLLGYRSYWMRDAGIRNTKESAMVKWYGVSEVALNALHFSMRIFGHYGVTRDFDVAQRLLDTFQWEYGDGAVEAQKLVIARHYLGRENCTDY
jgi:cyclohexanecarboxyl-CoA dehydrogenase